MEVYKNVRKGTKKRKEEIIYKKKKDTDVDKKRSPWNEPDNLYKNTFTELFSECIFREWWMKLRILSLEEV